MRNKLSKCRSDVQVNHSASVSNVRSVLALADVSTKRVLIPILLPAPLATVSLYLEVDVIHVRRQVSSPVTVGTPVHPPAEGAGVAEPGCRAGGIIFIY